MQGGEVSHTRITGNNMKVRHSRVLRESKEQGVFTGARADNKNAHGCQFM